MKHECEFLGLTTQGRTVVHAPIDESVERGERLFADALVLVFERDVLRDGVEGEALRQLGQVLADVLRVVQRDAQLRDKSEGED